MITNEEFLQRQAEYEARRAQERGEELLHVATERAEWMAFVKEENRIQVATMLIAAGRHINLALAFCEADKIIAAGRKSVP